MSLDWRGPEVLKKLLSAAERGINVTMALAVRETKGKHPGWSNVTGTAEGSVRIIKFARRSGNAIAGEWGSLGVKYVLFLEVKHGSFLRNSADRNYPRVTKAIRSSFGG